MANIDLGTLRAGDNVFFDYTSRNGNEGTYSVLVVGVESGDVLGVKISQEFSAVMFHKVCSRVSYKLNASENFDAIQTDYPEVRSEFRRFKGDSISFLVTL